MSLLTPDFGLIFWMLVCFLVLLFILGKYGWPVIIGMIDKRGSYIEESLKAANDANERLKNIQAESEKILVEAKNAQIRILKEATAAKNQMIADAQKQAGVEAEKIIEAARADIRTEKENAIREIRSQVAELSVDVAEKVLRKELADQQSQVDMINRLLDEINIVKS
jgi:F-type H+-transporting ATPase subunit b